MELFENLNFHELYERKEITNRTISSRSLPARLSLYGLVDIRPPNVDLEMFISLHSIVRLAGKTTLENY